MAVADKIAIDSLLNSTFSLLSKSDVKSISDSLTSLENAFNVILTSTTNIKNIEVAEQRRLKAASREIQAETRVTNPLSLQPQASQEFNVKTFKSFDETLQRLNDTLRQLDLTPKQGGVIPNADIDINIDRDSPPSSKRTSRLSRLGGMAKSFAGAAFQVGATAAAVGLTGFVMSSATKELSDFINDSIKNAVDWNQSVFGFGRSVGQTITEIPNKATDFVQNVAEKFTFKRTPIQEYGKPGQKVVAAGKGFTTIEYEDGRVERRVGSRNWRNNNPGNLEYGSFAKTYGAIGSDGRFAVFPSYAMGRAAKKALLFGGSRYKNLSVEQALYRYAPPSENNTLSYIGAITNTIGAASQTLLQSLSDEQKNAMLNVMERVEGFKQGKVEVLKQGSRPIPQPVQSTTPSIPTPQPPNMAVLNSRTSRVGSTLNNAGQPSAKSSSMPHPNFSKGSNFTGGEAFNAVQRR